MRVEDLAQKHLGVDLTRPPFWQSAIDVATAGLAEFLEATDGQVSSLTTKQKYGNMSSPKS